MNKLKGMIKLICKAVSLAMGVAVAVLAVMNSITANNAVLLLGIGLACVGIGSFIKTDSRNCENTL